MIILSVTFRAARNYCTGKPLWRCRARNQSRNPDRLKALGVTAADVNNAIRSLNIDLTGGRGDIAGREQSIRTLGGANSIEDLQRMRIPLPTGVNVRLDEIAEVKDSFTEQRSFALTNGTPVVAFAIFRSKGQSDVDVKSACLPILHPYKKPILV